MFFKLATRVFAGTLLISVVTATARAAPPAPTPQSPPNGAQVTQPVTLSWSAVADRTGIDGYIWDISTTSTFASRVAGGSTNHDGLQASLSGLPNGTYFWRVRAFNGAFDQSPNSAPQSFTVVGSVPETPATPSILYPPNGLAIHPWEGLDVRYSPVADVAMYELDIADEPSFNLDNGGYLTGRSVGPVFGFAVADPGTRYIRVRAIGNNGLRSPPSATVQFTVSFNAPLPPAPTLLAPANAATVTFPFTFDWTDPPNNQTDGYELQIDNDSTFPGGTGSVDLTVTDLFTSSFTLNDQISTGSKFWRVRSFHGSANDVGVAAVSAWSAVRSFTLSAGAPALVSLDQQATTAFSGSNAGGFVQLSGPATGTGAVVGLSSSNPSVMSVPATVTVPTGSARLFVPFTAGDVTTDTSVTVQASYAGKTAAASYTIRPATLLRMEIFALDTSAPWTQITMRGKAPPGGATIALASSNPALLGAPATATIPAGGTFVNVFLVPGAAPFGESLLTATYNGRGVQAPALKRNSVPPSAMVLEPRTTIGGSSEQPDAVVSLAGPFIDVFGAEPVTFTSSNVAVATLTDSMWVDRLSSVPVLTRAVTTPTPVTISATAGGVTVSGTLMVLPPGGGGGGGGGTQTFVGRVERNSTRTHSVAIGTTGTVAASLTWTGNIPLTFSARNSAGTTLASVSGPSPLQLSFNATAPGTYTFVLRNDSTSKRADYTLRVTPPAGGGGGADTTAPSVAVTVPGAGSTIGGVATVGASVTENGDIARVDFFSNGTLIGAATMPPFSILWDTRSVSPGGHSLTARAIDGAGNSTVSGPVTVTIDNSTPPDTTPPTAQMTWPLAGEVLVKQLLINIEAIANDNRGLARVEFYADGRLIHTDPDAPYSVSWFTAFETDGAHALTARAVDRSGNATVSAPITVIVDNGNTADTTPPTVSMTAPADGSVVSGTVSLAADAADNIGVVRVEFLIDGALAASDTSSPFAASWNSSGVSNGGHVLLARALDAAGNAADSAPIAVVVDNPPASDTTPPTVSVTSPAAGATVGGNVTIAAAASDNVGVARVDFLVDGAVIGSDTGAPYSLAWNSATVPDGPHSLSARAFDAAGNSALSGAVAITVTQSSPPVLTLTLSGIPSTIRRGEFLTATGTVANSGGSTAGGLTMGISFQASDALRTENPRTSSQSVGAVEAGTTESVTWLLRAERSGTATITFTLRDSSGGVVTSKSQQINITD